MKSERDIGARKGMGFGAVVRSKLSKKIRQSDLRPVKEGGG